VTPIECRRRKSPMLEFLNNLWELGTDEPSRQRVIIPARQATYAGGIYSLESILCFIKILKIRALKNVGSPRDERTKRVDEWKRLQRLGMQRTGGSEDQCYKSITAPVKKKYSSSTPREWIIGTVA
jgi:hypothetical protein